MIFFACPARRYKWPGLTGEGLFFLGAEDNNPTRFFGDILYQTPIILMKCWCQSSTASKQFRRTSGNTTLLWERGAGWCPLNRVRDLTVNDPQIYTRLPGTALCFGLTRTARIHQTALVSLSRTICITRMIPSLGRISKLFFALKSAVV